MVAKPYSPANARGTEKMGDTGLVFLPAWIPSHLAAMVETAKRIMWQQEARDEKNLFSITVLLIQPPDPASSSTLSSYVQSVTTSGINIHFQDLPPVDAPNETDGMEDLVSLDIQNYRPHVKAALSQSSTPVAALFIDLFATTIIDVAADLGIPAYIVFTPTAAMLALTLHLPILHEKIQVEFEELESDVEVPGVSPIPPLSLRTPFMNKKSGNYTWFVYHAKRYLEAKGIIVNTFMELEPKPLKAMMDGDSVPGRPPPAIYPIGPVLALGDDTNKANSERHECLKWLDGQPPASVVFLCFGSGGTFRAEQVQEMAIGLEKSGHRFLWCVRTPSTGKFQLPVDANLEEILPKRFMERTQERGLVWPSWAPQKEILAHRAVGGFVTHCGWNSVLESLWFGVPMLGWPLYAEQHLNAFEIVTDIGVAVKLKVDRKRGGFVEAEELDRGVKRLMGNSEEGKKVRAKVDEMRLASRKALGKGGSSYAYLNRLIDEIIGN